MLAMLNISRASGKSSLLKASFHEVPGKKDLIGEAYKAFTARPSAFPAILLNELKSQDVPIRFYFCSPEVPKDMQMLLHRSLMSYWRATLPQQKSLIKVCRDLDKKDVFNILRFSSDHPMPDEYAPIAQEKNPIKLGIKLFDALDGGFRHPVNVEFEEGIPENIKELISNVIDLYNSSIEPKIKVKT